MVRPIDGQAPGLSILNSWKEIAAYLGRGVRTVQRWEKVLDLPVHRPRGKDRSAVLALREELDVWLRGTPIRGNANGHEHAPNGASDAATLLLGHARNLLAEGERLLNSNATHRPEAEKSLRAIREIVRELTAHGDEQVPTIQDSPLLVTRAAARGQKN